MNPYAYRTTALAIKTFSNLSRARVFIHGKANIPIGPKIFVINHFTRIETLLMPYHINRLIGVPVWSLADYSFFKGTFGSFLDAIGAVSTRSPDRDRLIVKTLLTGEAAWIVFPEGRMVKSKKIINQGRFMILSDDGRNPPHTGAAALALRTEFYRRRILKLSKKAPEEAGRLLNLFQIDAVEAVLQIETHIVPVNITYYPIRARENAASGLVSHLVDRLPERAMDELMTEGTMLLSGVDIDVRFGAAIEIEPYLSDAKIRQDISTGAPINFDDPIRSRPVMRKTSSKLMHRYMSEIYGMTAVNHDHLFATVLRLMPQRVIDPYDLRQRVYLAASADLKRLGIFCHRALALDQLHLLTDDSSGKFADFLALAFEKRVLSERGEKLVKKRAKSARQLNFHRIRIENPLEVIANEIEPLKRLQRRLKLLAWLPRFYIRRRLAERLLRQDRQEYEIDYRAFYREGESKPPERGRPYLIKGKSHEIGILMIHGYLASPLEVRELAGYLGRHGFCVYVPRLRGHGTSPEDLAIRKYQDWIESVNRGYAIVRSLCRRIVVGGFSTGAALALDLAARITEIAGVFAVSPPLRLQDFSSRFAPAVDTWNRIMGRVRFDGVKKEFVENKPENPHINYWRNPISGVHELERLMESLEPRLPQVKAPALVVQSRLDPVVDYRGSRRAFEQLGSADKQYVLFNYERHGILLGPGADRVHQTIAEFIENLK